jgi:hypothetical protein
MPYYVKMDKETARRRLRDMRSEEKAYFAVRTFNEERNKLTQTMPEVSENLNIRIRPQYLHNLRALAAFKADLSQRVIIETALDKYFQDHKDELDRALIHYDQRE